YWTPQQIGVSHDILQVNFGFENIVGITGYFSESQGLHNVVVATKDGKLHDLYWTPQQIGVSHDILQVNFGFENIVGITGYFSESQGLHNVVVATKDGKLHDLYWTPQQIGVSHDILQVNFGFENIVGITGYVSESQGLHNVVVATKDGKLHDLYWTPQQIGVSHDILQVNFGFENIVGITGYVSESQGLHNVVVATKDGKLHDLYWTPQQIGVSHDILQVNFGFENIVGITGYVSEIQGLHNVVVATKDGKLHDLYWTPQQIGVSHDILQVDFGFENIVGITGYFSESQGLHNVVVATKDGKLHDLYWTPQQIGVSHDIL